MKHLANIITASRFVFAGLILWPEVFSTLFWVWYLCGGLSDLLDGPVARKLHQKSAFGAKLDSAADLVFIVCTAIAVLPHVAFPVWALILIGVIVTVRLTSYAIGWLKFRTYTAIHTWLNKATGILLFLFPVQLWLLGVDVACIVTCGVALPAAIEELILIIRSKELERDRKSLFIKRS